MKPYIIPFEELKNKDVDLVGGKNASIGEMISGLANLGVSVPGGFATTSWTDLRPPVTIQYSGPTKTTVKTISTRVRIVQ